MTAEECRKLALRMFPEGFPRLWCPMITHYDDSGAIDPIRMEAHLKHLSQWVKGFLAPGSTGDGWEMKDEEVRNLLDQFIRHTVRLKVRLLIGVLKHDVKSMTATIKDTMMWLRHRANTFEDAEAFSKSGVCGFTICPPRGKERTQQQIQEGLDSILKLGVPIALYQLPQVTMNEMSPELVSALAVKFPNFILFKDTSGVDRVAASGRDFANVFKVRGAEGDYARWLKSNGGVYDGWLLSTANCFAMHQASIIEMLMDGKRKDAEVRSNRLSSVVKELFSIVSDVKAGNPFANANKAADHYFAYGPRARALKPPMLHAGVRLPEDVIDKVGDALVNYHFMPERGYLE